MNTTKTLINTRGGKPFPDNTGSRLSAVIEKETKRLINKEPNHKPHIVLTMFYDKCMKKLTKALSKEYRITQFALACNTLEFVHKFRESVDLIITDELPETEGLQLVKVIKSTPSLKDMPIIMHSESTKVYDELGEKLDGFLEIPYSETALNDEVQKVLSRKITSINQEPPEIYRSNKKHIVIISRHNNLRRKLEIALYNKYKVTLFKNADNSEKFINKSWQSINLVIIDKTTETNDSELAKITKTRDALPNHIPVITMEQYRKSNEVFVDRTIHLIEKTIPQKVPEPFTYEMTRPGKTEPETITVNPGVKDGILLVTDDEKYRKMILEELGCKFDIYQFRNAEDALEFYEDNRSVVNLVLTDDELPKMQGWQMLKEITMMRYPNIIDDKQKWKILPFVMQSYNPEIFDLIGFSLKGILRKPYDRSKLLEEVKKSFDFRNAMIKAFNKLLGV